MQLRRQEADNSFAFLYTQWKSSTCASYLCREDTACLPKVEFPPNWQVTCNPNHWSNEETMLGYLHHILISYVGKIRSDRNLSTTHAALIIFDHFKVQMTERFLNTLEKNNIHVVEVPANCTDCLQPLDPSINKPLKSHMKNSFQHL